MKYKNRLATHGEQYSAVTIDAMYGCFKRSPNSPCRFETSDDQKHWKRVEAAKQLAGDGFFETAEAMAPCRRYLKGHVSWYFDGEYLNPNIVKHVWNHASQKMTQTAWRLILISNQRTRELLAPERVKAVNNYRCDRINDFDEFRKYLKSTEGDGFSSVDDDGKIGWVHNLAFDAILNWETHRERLSKCDGLMYYWGKKELWNQKKDRFRDCNFVCGEVGGESDGTLISLHDVNGTELEDIVLRLYYWNDSTIGGIL